MALMPVADALAGAEPLPEEMVALDAAYHRVLARDVAAAAAGDVGDGRLRGARVPMPPTPMRGCR